jgi:hypothetical protein
LSLPVNTAPRIYLDTSAYLAIVLDEEQAAALKTAIRGAQLLSSVLLQLEARRNLVRLARQQAIDATQYAACVAQLDDDITRIDLRDLTMEMCCSGPLPPVATPRSLDLVHLRTALWFHQEAPIDRFVTLDLRQEQAAKELGLPI